jgi:hypothetical protein
LFFAVLVWTIFSFFVDERAHPAFADGSGTNDLSLSHDSDARRWIAPTVFGLTLGSSTESDVKRVFGARPSFQDAAEEKLFTSDDEDEIEIEYMRVVSEEYGGIGNISFTVGKTSKIVKAISFFLDSTLTEQEAVRKYGGDFFEIESSDPLCISNRADLKPGERPEKLNYPIFLVYPNKGRFIFINMENKALYFSFLYKCNT